MEGNGDIRVGAAHRLHVIVSGDGHVAADRFRAQVQRALMQAGIECTVLHANGTSDQAMPGDAASLPGCAPIAYSAVVPVLNEQDNLPELYRRLRTVLDALHEPCEMVFVDDGSQDRSLAILRDLHACDPRVRVVVLARNFGHQRAISAGLEYARGRCVVVMDADLQDPPEVIPMFVDKWRQGYQVVYAIREKRKEHILKRGAYHLFYLILRQISRIDIPLDAGDFCLLDRCVVDALNALPERNRFVRGLRSWVGFRQTGLAYERHVRFGGRSKYTVAKLVRLALDGMISFSYMPLRLATLLGFTVSIASLIAAAAYFVQKITVGLQPPGFATLVVLVSLLGGIQLVTIGVVGEYVGHVLDEVKGRPTYIVSEVLAGESYDDRERMNADPAHLDPG